MKYINIIITLFLINIVYGFECPKDNIPINVGNCLSGCINSTDISIQYYFPNETISVPANDTCNKCSTFEIKYPDNTKCRSPSRCTLMLCPQ